MSPFKRNMTRVVIFTSIVLFTAAISSGIYYMKIKKNENIQNQLQFRELRVASTGIGMSLEKLKPIAKYFRANMSCDTINSSSVGNKFDLESACNRVITEKISQINQSMDLRNIRIKSIEEYTSTQLDSFDAAKEIEIRDDGFTHISTYLPIKIDDIAGYKHAKVVLTVPTRDLIPNRLDLFSLVMVSDQEGNLLGRRDYPEQQISALDLRFSSLKKYIDAENNFVSHIKDVDIAGIEYRMYIQPLEGSEVWAQQGNKLIVGLIPLSTININKLMISPVVIMWVVLALLLLIAFTPLLKLRFINSKYAFTSSDVSQVALGLVLCAGILSIGLNQQMFYQYFMDSKIDQSKIILTNIQKDFLNEINTLVKFVENNEYKKEHLNKKTVDTETYKNVLNPNLKFDLPRPVRANSEETPPEKEFFIIEILAELGADGTFPDDSKVNYIKEDLFINTKIKLDKREYFKQTMACNTWKFGVLLTEAPNKANWCPRSLYIQRINNIEDGRKNSMLAMPTLSIKEENDENAKRIVIFNTHLKSFTNLVLPLDFGFAVFDDKGDVLYHSDDEASLIENIFVETGQNEQFITAVKQHTNADSPIPLSLKYGGKNHLFLSAPLVTKQKQQSIPWNIVVFYDEGAMAMNSMLLVFLAVLTFFSIIVPMFFLLRYLSQQHFWIQVLYFNEKKTSHYKGWSIFIASLSACCLMNMGMVDDLIFRIAMWLVFCLISVIFLHRVHAVDMTGFKRIYYPSAPIIGVIIFLILLGVSLRPLDWSFTNVNYIAGFIGLLILLACLRIVLPELTNKPISSSANDAEQSTNNDDCKIRPREYADEQRFTGSYLAYLLSLVILAGAVPSILITNSTHGYLLQRQAEMQSVAINESKSKYVNANTQYLDFLQLSNDKPLLQARTAWGGIEDWKKIFSSALLSQDKDEGGKETSWIKIDGLVLGDNNQSDTKDVKSNNLNYSDDLLDIIFASLSIQDSLGTQLTYFALKDKEDRANGSHNNSQEFNLLFRPDKYMLAASLATVANIVVGTLLMLFALYKTLQYLVVTRLMGEHVPEHFRVVRPCDAYSEEQNRWPLLRKLALKLKLAQEFKLKKVHTKKDKEANVQSFGGTHILLLNANANSALALCKKLGIDLHEDKTLHISDILDINANIFVFEDALRHHLSAESNNVATIAICGLDEISDEESTRKIAAKALSRLVTMKQINIILVADTAPGYRLLRNEAYNLGHEKKNQGKIDIDEKLSWSKLLTFFDKEYAWAPKQKLSMSNSLNITQTIAYEGDGWHELEAVKDKFYEYHMRIKSPCGIKDDVQKYWLPEQIVEFFMIQAGPLYRKHWELCTVDEKVALWQLAHESKINPANAEVIQHLTRRGFIYRDKGWHIINESFRRFILRAESASVIDNWMDSTRSGLWPIVRIPLFTILFVLVVVVIYSSGFALNSVLGVATTTLGIIPLLLKNLNLIRTNSPSLGE